MNIDNFRKIIEKREFVERISCGEWADGIEDCWKQEIEVLSEDVEGTISFLKTQCTAAEYSWISEVIDELADITQSKELIKVYKSLLIKFPEESKKYYIGDVIKIAEAMLEEEVDNVEGI